jgi:hypothetical protein
VTVTLVWPAEPTVTVPAHAHEHVDASSSAGLPSTVTLVEPGVHGLSTGWHGCGVRTPWADAVALATCGLAIDMHMPNAGTFAAPQSVIAPAAISVPVMSVLDALKVAGVVPNEHCSDAPVQTRLPIAARTYQST